MPRLGPSRGTSLEEGNMFETRIIEYLNIPEMETYISEKWSDWGRETFVTGRCIDQFAAVTDNHQWIHEDSDRIAESPYGARIAHGLLLVSLIPSLLPDEPFEMSGYRVRIVRGVDRLRLPSPVYVGDRIHARSRIRAVYAARSGKGTVIERDIEVWSSSGGEKPAVSCVLKLQYF